MENRIREYNNIREIEINDLMHYIQYLVAIKYEVVLFIDKNESLRSSEGSIVEETQYNIT